MSARSKEVRIIVAVLCVAGLGSGALLALRPPSHAKPPAPPEVPSRPVLKDAFDLPVLDPTSWTVVSEGDFQERRVDLQGGRLRLRCATIGTNDRTVKFLGIGSVPPVALRDGLRLSADLDWNDQANGSYLSAALVLAPEATTGNPLTQRDWLRVEYVGVPPGKNGRLVVAQRVKGRDLLPYTEGWPQTRREGRTIKVQKVELVIRNGSVEVWENGQMVHQTTEKLSFDRAHLYLLMSSHSNYPPREVFWDNIRIE